MAQDAAGSVPPLGLWVALASVVALAALVVRCESRRERALRFIRAKARRKSLDEASEVELGKLYESDGDGTLV
ncbi:hypothetical protein M885DRAFT_519931 [Pelagophyceae sp. CCMP2097]|nr:hypothetical protein M885DRAFT_519931 [Pelagophyceae sp. CCMP2097]